MLSPGNPETLIEMGEKVKIFGYLGQNKWRCMASYCKGFCKKTTILNPKIRSQNQVK